MTSRSGGESGKELNALLTKNICTRLRFRTRVLRVPPPMLRLFAFLLPLLAAATAEAAPWRVQERAQRTAVVEHAVAKTAADPCTQVGAAPLDFECAPGLRLIYPLLLAVEKVAPSALIVS